MLCFGPNIRRAPRPLVFTVRRPVQGSDPETGQGYVRLVGGFVEAEL